MEKINTESFYLFEKSLVKKLEEGKLELIKQSRKDAAKSLFENVETPFELTDEEIEKEVSDILESDEEDEEITESIMVQIDKAYKNKKETELKLKNGQTIDVSKTDVRLLSDYIKNKLSPNLKSKYEDMLSKNAKTFMMALNLATK